MKRRIPYVFYSFLLLISILATGCSGTINENPQPEDTGETMDESMVEISVAGNYSLSQQADGVTYTVSNVSLYPRNVYNSASDATIAPYLLQVDTNFSGVDPNLLVSLTDATVSLSEDFSEPLEPVNFTSDAETLTCSYFYNCNVIPDTIYFQPGKYSLLTMDETVVTNIDSLTATATYDESAGKTKLVLEYTAEDLPYIPQLVTILAAKNSTAESSNESLSYNSILMNNYRDENGNFLGGSWTFLIPGEFEPTTYYDILFRGYEVDLQQANVIEIPLQETVSPATMTA